LLTCRITKLGRKLDAALHEIFLPEYKEYFNGFMNPKENHMKKAILACLLLAGCATPASGPMFSADSLPPVKGSQIVVYRPSEFGLAKNAAIKVNGVDKCTLPPKSFAVIPADIGNNSLKVGMWDGGTSETFLDANKGKRMFVRVTYNTPGPGAAFGLVGALMDNSIDNGGPFDLRLVTEQQARSELSDLRQGC
jgi:hypothetical protein